MKISCVCGKPLWNLTDLGKKSYAFKMCSLQTVQKNKFLPNSVSERQERILLENYTIYLK